MVTQIKTHQFRENLNPLPAESSGSLQARSPGLGLSRAFEITLIHQQPAGTRNHLLPSVSQGQHLPTDGGPFWPFENQARTLHPCPASTYYLLPIEAPTWYLGHTDFPTNHENL